MAKPQQRSCNTRMTSRSLLSPEHREGDGGQWGVCWSDRHSCVLPPVPTGARQRPVWRDTPSKQVSGSCSWHDGMSPSNTAPAGRFSSLLAGYAYAQGEQLENRSPLSRRLAESRGDKLQHFGATRYKPPPRLRPPPAPRQSLAAGGGATPAARHVGMLFAGRPLASPYWRAPSAAMRLPRVSGTLVRSLRLCGYCNPGA
jgi:hypothetical protein